MKEYVNEKIDRLKATPISPFVQCSELISTFVLVTHHI